MSTLAPLSPPDCSHEAVTAEKPGDRLFLLVWVQRQAGYRPHMTLGDGVHEAGLSHVALLYDNDDELLDAAVPFLADGVASGAPTLLSVETVSDR